MLEYSNVRTSQAGCTNGKASIVWTEKDSVWTDLMAGSKFSMICDAKHRVSTIVIAAVVGL